MNQRLGWIGLGLAAALFIGLNLFAGPVLRGFRADLTEQKLYTLSDGTKNILRNLEEPITLRYYFARGVAQQDVQPLLNYADRVQEMLEEYSAVAGSTLTLEIIDPEPYSEAEEDCVAFGIEGRPANAEGDRFYIGIVGTNSVDDQEVLPVLDPRRESYLEYELTELIDRLQKDGLPTVGLVTSLPLRGGMQPAAQPGAQPQQLPPWPIMELIERRYEVRELSPATLTEIPDDISILLLVHPKGLTPEGSYAIDQYALRGGKVLAFVDSFCYFDPASQSNDPMAQLQAGMDSGIDQLLLAWGVALAPGKVAGDDTKSLGVGGRDGRQVQIPIVFDVDAETMDAEDIVVSELQQMRFFLPGSVSKADDAPEGVQVEPLVTTTAEGGGTVDAFSFISGLDPQAVADSFVANAPETPLAVRVRGDVRTAFPDGPPEAADAEGETEDESPADSPAEPDHLAVSSAPFNAIVVADADMLHSDIWAGAPMRDIFGRVRYVAQTDNPSLLVSALENLSGSSDLISLRSRAAYARPFEVKERMLEDAQARFREKQTELEEKLQAADDRFAQLQSEKDPANAFLLTPEQEEEIANARKERLDTRKQLRRVQQGLRSEIDALGTRLKLMNILGVPALICLLGLLVRFLGKGARSA